MSSTLPPAEEVGADVASGRSGTCWDHIDTRPTSGRQRYGEMEASLKVGARLRAMVLSVVMCGVTGSFFMSFFHIFFLGVQSDWNFLDNMSIQFRAGIFLDCNIFIMLFVPAVFQTYFNVLPNISTGFHSDPWLWLR